MDLDVMPLHEGNAVPAALIDHAGLVVLGGRMGAYDDQEVRWLTPVKALIATVVAGRDPFLGICLGHQLAAVALGGTVEANPRGPARGLTPVRLTEAGLADPVLSAVPDGAIAVQWNNDVVTVLPRRAQLLASAPDGTVQAARFGRRAWGVQFHPEVSAAILRSWALESPEPDTGPDRGVDLPAVLAAIEAREERLRRDWAPLARAFAAMVGD